jgi:hypothetical protein
VAFSIDTKVPAAGVVAAGVVAAAAVLDAAVLLELAAGVLAAAAVSGPMTTAPITPPVSIDADMTPPAMSLLDAFILISPWWLLICWEVVWFGSPRMGRFSGQVGAVYSLGS